LGQRKKKLSLNIEYFRKGKQGGAGCVRGRKGERKGAMPLKQKGERNALISASDTKDIEKQDRSTE